MSNNQLQIWSKIISRGSRQRDKGVGKFNGGSGKCLANYGQFVCGEGKSYTWVAWGEKCCVDIVEAEDGLIGKYKAFEGEREGADGRCE